MVQGLRYEAGRPKLCWATGRGTEPMIHEDLPAPTTASSNKKQKHNLARHLESKGLARFVQALEVGLGGGMMDARVGKHQDSIQNAEFCTRDSFPGVRKLRQL